MILIVGGTGLLGGLITAKLLAQGKQVRILLRPDSPSEDLAKQGLATSAQSLIEAGAQPVYGDLKDRASLDQACRGVSTVLATAASTLRDFDIEGVDLNGMLSLIDAAKEAGVKHFIYTSVNGADLNSPNPVLKIKAVCEQALKESGLPYTLIAPGIFMEVWVGNVVGIPLRAGQPVTLVGNGDHRHSFITIEDVANFAVAVVDNPNAINQRVLVGGLASHSWTEVVKIVGQEMGQELPINYITPDQPVPLLHPGVGDMLKAMESFESYIDMEDTAKQYGVELTPLGTFARRTFARSAN
jgi:uncharacterized protein YbjT (DUF2867 family)